MSLENFSPRGTDRGLHLLEKNFRPEPGRVVVAMPAAEFHYNPLGGVHGGVISTLLDTAAGCAVHSTLAVGEGYTSLDLTDYRAVLDMEQWDLRP